MGLTSRECPSSACDPHPTLLSQHLLHLNGWNFLFPQSLGIHTHDTEYLDMGGKHLLPDLPFLIQIPHLHANSLEANVPTSEDPTRGGWGHRRGLLNRVSG